MKILVINACVRESRSRSWKLAEACLEGMKEAAKEPVVCERLNLMEMNLSCLSGAYFEEREQLLAEGNRSHPRFDLAHQFADADVIVIAAPFWDLSIPAILKVYIENISVDGITFGCDERGMFGLCKAQEMLFLTTRGSVYGSGPLAHLEQGARYLEALCEMYGIAHFSCICAEGIDAQPETAEERVKEACEEARKAGRALLRIVD